MIIKNSIISLYHTFFLFSSRKGFDFSVFIFDIADMLHDVVHLGSWKSEETKSKNINEIRNEIRNKNEKYEKRKRNRETVSAIQIIAITKAQLK